MWRKAHYVGSYLLLGLLAHLAVVLMCAFAIEIERAESIHGVVNAPVSHWHFKASRTPGAIRVSAFAGTALYAGPNATCYTFDQRTQSPGKLEGVPRWSQVYEDPTGPSVYNHEDARGWPMPSLRASYHEHHIAMSRDELPGLKLIDRTANSLIVGHVDTDRVSEVPLAKDGLVSGGLLLPSSRFNAYGYQTVSVLPLTPIWPEFIANTAFYTLVIWLVIGLPRAIRRRRRIRREQCPSCGYPRGTSPVCTECGSALAAAA